MDKAQALERLTSLEKEAAELRNIIEAEDQPTKPTPKERLLQLIEGTVNHFDSEYPESVFWMKDGIVFFELDFKRNVFSCRYGTVWSVFETEYKMEYYDIQKLIKYVVEERYKIGSLTPQYRQQQHLFRVEERYKTQ